MQLDDINVHMFYFITEKLNVHCSNTRFDELGTIGE